MPIHNRNAAFPSNGHADAGSPVCEVRIPAQRLECYFDHLRTKRTECEMPETTDAPQEGRKTEMNIIGPSVKHLVF